MIRQTVLPSLTALLLLLAATSVAFSGSALKPEDSANADAVAVPYEDFVLDLDNLSGKRIRIEATLVVESWHLRTGLVYGARPRGTTTVSLANLSLANMKRLLQDCERRCDATIIGTVTSGVLVADAVSVEDSWW